MALADPVVSYQPDSDKHAGVLVRKLEALKVYNKLFFTSYCLILSILFLQAYDLVQGNLVSVA